jgi:hypothetical protein
MNTDSVRLQNVANVVAFCERKQNEYHVDCPNVRRDVVRYFHLVRPKDVDHGTSWDCKKIDDS